MCDPRARRLLLAGGLVVAVGCGRARPVVDGTPRCASWKEEVGPLLADRCGSCHTGPAAAGHYDVGQYLTALGPASAPVAIAGDPGSIILQTLDPATAPEPHRDLGDAAERVRSWVIDCRLSY